MRSIGSDNYLESSKYTPQGQSIKRRENDEFPSRLRILTNPTLRGGLQLSRGHCERVLSGVETRRDTGRGSVRSPRKEQRQLERQTEIV